MDARMNLMKNESATRGPPRTDAQPVLVQTAHAREGRSRLLWRKRLLLPRSPPPRRHPSRSPPPPAPNVTARGMIVLMCLRRMLECPCFGCGAFPGVALCTQVQTVDVAADSVDEASLAFTGWTPSPEVSAFLRDAGRTMLSELSRSATSRAFDGEGTPGLAVTAVCGSGCNSRSLVNHALALVLHCVGSGAA